MGAETRVYVQVVRVRPYREWVEVSAVTLQEAKAKAMELPYVADVIEAQYDEPGAMRSCNACDWKGPTADCVHPKHDSTMLLCPECHETTDGDADVT